MSDHNDVMTISRYQCSVSVTINALPPRVWQAMTDEMSEWFPGHFFSSEQARRFVLEPKLGGRAYEDWGGDAGALWATVVGWAPPTRMIWACEMYPGFGGPGRSYVTVTISPFNNQTTVTLTDEGLCPEPDRTCQSLATGWEEWLNCLKSYVER